MMSTCLFTCFKISSSKFYITLHTFREYILCKAYDIQSPWKYFPYTLNTYISSHDGMVQEGCDCTVSNTQEQASVSFISL